MRSGNRRWSTRLEASAHSVRALLLAGGVAASLAAGAAYADPTPGNWLYLEFSPTQQVRYVANGVEATRALVRVTDTNCELDVGSPLSELLVFSSPTHAVGWKPADQRIGVTCTDHHQSCTEVRSRQSIALELGSQLGAQKVVNAHLSLLVAKAARIRVRAYDQDSADPDPVHQFVLTCDAGTCPLELLQSAASPSAATKTWDRLVLKNLRDEDGVAGVWSLGASEFELLPFVKEGNLACTETATEGGASLRRLFDAAGSEADVCGQEIPYRLDFEGNTLTFLADYSVLPEGVEPAFEFNVTSAPEIVELSGYLPIPFETGEDPNPPASLVTFLQAVPLSIQWFDDENNKFLLDLCPGQPDFTPAVPPSGSDPGSPAVLNGVTFPTGFDVPGGSADMSPTLAGFQYGCLVEQRRIRVLDQSRCGIEVGAGDRVDSADTICVQVRERGYIRGDYTKTRVYR